jgi:dihydrofolate reductase
MLDDMIRLIAAMDSRRGMATASGIPGKLPGDTAYFRERTTTGVILMGRGTYDEFAAPLHGRESFVLSAKSGVLRTGLPSGRQPRRAASVSSERRHMGYRRRRRLRGDDL